MTDDTWKAVEAYCRSVTRYFHASANLGNISWYSYFLDYTEHCIREGVEDIWENMPIALDPRRDMLVEVDQVLRTLPKSFDRVCMRYADLRSIMR